MLSSLPVLWAPRFSKEAMLTGFPVPHELPRANLTQVLILATCDMNTSGVSQKGM